MNPKVALLMEEVYTINASINRIKNSLKDLKPQKVNLKFQLLQLLKAKVGVQGIIINELTKKKQKLHITLDKGEE